MPSLRSYGRAGRRLALLVTVAVVTVAAVASAKWSDALLVSDDSTQAYGYFTQSVGPDGAATIAWVKWSTGGDPQTVESRTVGAGGSLGTIRRLSEPDPEAFGTYVSGLDVTHATSGDAMAAWLEIALTGSSCVTYGYGYSFGGEEDCVVHYYVRARSLPSGAAPGPVRTLGESEYSPGTIAESAFLSSPQVVLDTTGAATVAWTSTTLSAGCNNYYSYGYDYGGPSSCTADTLIEARGISAAGNPDAAAILVFESHSVGGYGRSELGDLVVAPDGNVTVAWLKAPSLDNYYCAGGSDVAVELRRIEAGGPGPIQALDVDGDEGECGWTAPRASVSAGGMVTLAWGRPGGVVYGRVGPGNSPPAVQEIDGATLFSSPDVAVGPDGSATVVWSDGGDVRSRRIGPTGALAPARTLDSIASGSDYYYNPQIATAADGSTGVAWAWQRWTSDLQLGVKAVRLDPGGSPGSVQVLAGASPDRYFFRELPQVGGGASTLLAAWLAPGPGADAWHLPNSQVKASRFLPDVPAPPAAGPLATGSAPSTPRRGVASAEAIVPVKKGKAMLTLRCQDTVACAGALSLVTRQSPRGSKQAGKSRAGGREVTLGSSPFEVLPGKTATVAIKLSRKGKALVRAAGAGGLSADLRGTGVKNRTVHLKRAGADEGRRKPRR